MRSNSLIWLSILTLLLIAGTANAGNTIFVKEYTYQASELDSKISCRENALTQVKRLLLEELGSYLESYTELKKYELTKDDLASLTSGFVKTEIVDERWDGKSYWVKAKLTADPDEVEKSVDLYRKNISKDSKDHAQKIQAGKAYRISFFSASVLPGSYGNDDTNPAPDSYILVKDLASGGTLFNTGDAYKKHKSVDALLGNRNNYSPNFQGIGFTHTINNCILIVLMDWDGCEGFMCIKNSEDDIIGSEYKICPGDKIGKRWVKVEGWQLELEIVLSE
jgi:hypothetical protein